MTPEEKVKAYDKAIEVIRKCETDKYGCVIGIKPSDIFSELKESEDEKMIKWLIEAINFVLEDGRIFHNKVIDEAKDAIDWLEKQGDKDKLIKELGEYKVKYTQEVLEKHINSMSNKDEERLKKTTIAFLKDFADKGYENAVECIDWLENMGGQKPADKIHLGKKYKCIASPRYSTFMAGKIYKPEDKFLCDLMNFCSDCFEPIEDGEQMSADKVNPKFKVGDVVTNKKSKDTVKIVQILHDSYCYSGWDGAATVHSDIPFVKQDEWELVEQEVVEQKPADRVEQKFEIGDLITNGVLVGKIDEIYEYCGEFYYHVCFGDYYADVSDAENWHKWTINDAKDGDVLVSSVNQPFIYNGKFDETSVGAYCGLTVNKDFKVCINDYRWTYNENIKPATKIQRDQLEKAIVDAGYTFDFDKKELKKIDYKEEIKKCKDNPLYFFDKYVKVKLKEQNPTWSEEDEKEFEQLLNILHANGYESFDIWLKSLKERVQLQEWSDEDENGLGDTLWAIKQARTIAKDENDMGNLWYAERWLKSIKGRYAWKPSDEQMKELSVAKDSCFDLSYKTKDTLKSLYNDLKNLKE